MVGDPLAVAVGRIPQEDETNDGYDNQAFAGRHSSPEVRLRCTKPVFG
jgi:hypothetical protein